MSFGDVRAVAFSAPGCRDLGLNSAADDRAPCYLFWIVARAEIGVCAADDSNGSHVWDKILVALSVEP